MRMHQNPSISGMSAPATGWMRKRWIHDQMNDTRNDYSLPFEKPQRVRLLVDGDSFGSEQVHWAVAFLARSFDDVNAVIFGAPGLTKNKKMRELLLRSDISFYSVPRGENQAAEPNDDAIISEMQRCARFVGGECMGLLTADTGFAEILRRLISDNQPVFALIPSRSVPAANFYKEQGIPVISLPLEGSFSKVRAILDADGNGRVELADPFDPTPHWHKSEKMYNSWEQVLKEKGCPAAFSSSPGFRVQRIAKFWFQNGLGELTVYPSLLATHALDHAIWQRSQKWISKSEALAYLLPVSTGGRSTESVTKTYGSTRARSIFQGGGPMMLRDSHDLGTEALRKLGYLDDSWNSDLTEAVSCFWNATLNKYQLRKLGLISPYETTSGAVAKLRMALLSDCHSGYWQRGGTCTPAVVQILRGEKLLPMGCETPALQEVWSAMQTFARVHQLPNLKTLNALAGHIVQQYNQRCPHRRGTIRIEDDQIKKGSQ